ncbi:MAG: hypothetical protein ABL860_02375 [Candidatus Nitrotoga sp.]
MCNHEQPTKKDRESFVRWQSRTIEQFGYTLNLILGLSVAALGYGLSLFLNKEFRTEWQNCVLLHSMLSLLFSVFLGLWCVVNRLRDFRTTTKIALKREDGESDLNLQPLRTLACTLGKRTWHLLWWQIATFLAGILLLALAVIGSIKSA